jgi:hypothetical protein
MPAYQKMQPAPFIRWHYISALRRRLSIDVFKNIFQIRSGFPVEFRFH